MKLQGVIKKLNEAAAKVLGVNTFEICFHESSRC